MAAIAAGDGGGDGRAKPKPKPKPKQVVAPSELDRMVAESLRDIGSDEEMSGDENDPDLLNELSELAGGELMDEPAMDTVESPPPPPANENALPEPILPTTTLSTTTTLKERLAMYKLAEKTAKDAGDSSRARRFNRGLKTLESLLKQAEAGKPINNEDIPPVIAVKPAQSQNTDGSPPVSAAAAAATPATPATPPEVQTPTEVPASPVQSIEPVQPTTTNVDESKISVLLARQQEYKVAALNAKRSGDKTSALQYVKVIKVFDTVVQMARQGQPVDLSDMPPPPNELSADMLNAIGQASPPTEQAKQEDALQKATEPTPVAQPSAPATKIAPDEPPKSPKTILEALEQRLAKYQSQVAHAKEERNGGKERRMGRIVKQYQDAIKMHKAGKPVPFDELPTPPGFEPIPVGAGSGAAPIRPAPSSAPRPAPSSAPTEDTPASPSRPPLKKQDSRISGNHSATSVMNKSIEILVERQREFKEAALEAKRAGELEQAKEYLKTFKGLENLLDVARGGLPVDLSSVSETN